MDKKNVKIENSLAEKAEKEVMTFSLDEFTPEVFDCEADGSCGSGHIHIITKI